MGRGRVFCFYREHAFFIWRMLIVVKLSFEITDIEGFCTNGKKGIVRKRMYNVIDCYDLTVLKANLNDRFYEDYLYPEQFINNVYIKIFKGKELESLIIFKQSSTADNAREYKVNQICLYLDYFFQF